MIEENELETTPLHLGTPKDISEVFARANCLYGRTEVEAALDQLSVEMSAELEDKNPLFLCVLIGGIIPLGNLLPRLHFPLELDYVHATRYGTGQSGGILNWIAKPTHNLQGRTIVIVDDILDGGITMAEIVRYCEQQGAKKVYTAVLVDKVDARLEGGTPRADFAGLQVENHFVFGYGLDYKNYLRNIPGIYRIADSDAE